MLYDIIFMVKTKQYKMLGANKLSTFVANKLSGYYDSQKGGFHDLGIHTTGDTDNEIQKDLHRMEN